MTAVCTQVESTNWILGTLGFTVGGMALGFGALSSMYVLRAERAGLICASAAFLCVGGLGAMGFVAAHKLYRGDHKVSAVAIGVLSTLVVAATLPTARLFARAALPKY